MTLELGSLEIAKLCGMGVYVGSKDACASQGCVLVMLALYLGRRRHLSDEDSQRIIGELRHFLMQSAPL